MYYFKKFKKKVIDYLFDHPVQKDIMDNFYCLLVTALSSFVFAFGFKSFIQPNYAAVAAIDGADSLEMVEGLNIKTLASCGASGLSQVVLSIIKICGGTYLTDNTLLDVTYWCLYLGINIPLFLLAFFKVGKRFAIYSLINVGLASIFGIILPNSSPNDFINQVTYALGQDIVSRVLFGGLCTGIASALAYHIESTAGGTDIIAYYISEKKSVQVGKWSALFNLIIVSTYSILSTFPVDKAFAEAEMGAVAMPSALVIFLFTLFYMVLVTLVVDTINIQNKKVELQIMTSNYNLSNVVLANIPHGCTVLDAKGGYTGKQLYIIYMTVRKKEAKQVVKICRKVDPNVFINVMPMDQVYGRFYRKPIK